jgi:FkbM family methyltransferase
MKYYSQLGQDKLIDEYLNGKENGFFLDIGANDGKNSSNTLFFEEYRGWKGICIEPGPDEFEKLELYRNSINIKCCVSDYNGESDFTYIRGYSNMLSGLTETYDDKHKMRINSEVNSFGGEVINIKIPVFKLKTILDIHNITDVDYCSIDTEGSEFNVIKSIDFDKVNIKIFSIENNYGDTTIKKYLEGKGYFLYKKIQWDDIFIK